MVFTESLLVKVLVLMIILFAAAYREEAPGESLKASRDVDKVK
jgi:hypothetical protein